MRSLVAVGFILVPFLFLSSVSAQESPSPNEAKLYSELQDLSDDLSRTELFELVKEAYLAESPEDRDETMTWFNLYGPFRFPNDARYDAVLNKPRVDSIFGVDISHHTGSNFPVDTLQQKGVRFVYLKASQGISFKDGQFKNYWTKLDALPVGRKVHRGAYHFLSAQQKGKLQAQTFLAVLAANGGLKPTDMPPVVDLEWDKANSSAPDRWANIDRDTIIKETLAFLDEVEGKTGRRPMIYTARSWWRERFGSDAKFSAFAKYPIWIADYSKSSRASEIPRVPAGANDTIWQFTDAATMAAGYPKGFDANIFKGTEKDFYAKHGVAEF